ncbi:hypothetical protein BB560_001138 [Smittium megazygosporum]|uniref:Sensitive to high expression protein 9, mitochondrial n=1 Tax=Smittium megazygosporum TaxID=133381 RepID=A0A2T9ZIC7_9FUNG|nr:hypothetical protein BB560_001138 [Smittium megazygosporum]
MSSVINFITGYDKVIKQKDRVSNSYNEFYDSKSKLASLKKDYETTILDRTKTQREINMLLQRKNNWDEIDVSNFTSLYKNEHSLTRLEKEQKLKLVDLESYVDKCLDNMVASIRTRYQEEQNWSDKIRMISSYTTWLVLAVNIIAIILTQLLFEPRKRRKIIEGVDKKIVYHMESKQNNNNLTHHDPVPVVPENKDTETIGYTDLYEKSSVNTVSGVLLTLQEKEKLEKLLEKIDSLILNQNKIIELSKSKDAISPSIHAPENAGISSYPSTETKDRNPISGLKSPSETTVYVLGGFLLGGCCAMAVLLLNR